jgi:hypothetical protein
MRSVKIRTRHKTTREKRQAQKLTRCLGLFFPTVNQSTNQKYWPSTIDQATRALDFHCLGDSTPGTGNIRGHQPNKRITVKAQDKFVPGLEPNTHLALGQ